MFNVFVLFFFFFKQKTAYEIGLGIPAEPLFRSDACLSTEGVYCSRCVYYGKHQSFQATAGFRDYAPNAYSSSNGWSVFRSEERFSRNAETDLVCRLLLEKKNSTSPTHSS